MGKQQIVTNDTFQQVYDTLSKADSLAVDLETNSLNPYGANPAIVGISMSAIADSNSINDYYFPISHAVGENLESNRLCGLKALLAIPIPQIYWNSMFDMQFLRACGYTHSSKIRDAMLALHLLDENRQVYGLKPTARAILGAESAKEEGELDILLANNGWGKDEMWRLSPAEVAPYAMMDTNLTLQLAQRFAASLKASDLYEVWVDVCQYAVVLSHVSERGLKIDVDECERRIAEATTNYTETVKLLQARHGSDFNPNSPKKVQKALGVVGSTDEEVLGKLIKKGNDDAYLVLTARRWTKVRTAYYEPFLHYMDKNHVIHANLKAHGTITGRLSCSEPNLLAIPRKGEMSERDEPLPKTYAKSVFKAREGYKLAQLDYKRAEIYVATHFARALNMYEYLKSGADIHQLTAEAIGHPRDFAKRVNFSIIYGIGAKALATDLNIPVHAAQQILDDYSKIHPEFMQLYRRMEQFATRDGSIRLFTGRRIRYDTRKYADWHKASSNLVQGTVAEIIRIAMTKIHQDFRHFDVHQCLQVHDSDMIEVPEESGYLLPAIARSMTYMSDIYQFWIPLEVDIEVGQKWYELGKYKGSW